MAREVLGLRERGIDVDVYSALPPKPAELARLPENVRSLSESVRYVRGTEALSASIFAPSWFEARELNARLTRSVGRSPRSSLRLLRAAAIAQSIQQGQYDRLHAHWPYGTQLAMLVHAMVRLPLSISVHAHEVEHEGAHFPLAFERLDFAVFCNHAAMERLLAKLPPDARQRCHLAYHGVDLRQFQPRAGERARGAALRLFSAGRLTPTKGFDRLVRAVSAARQRDFEVDLTIVGEGAERPRLQQLAQSLGISEHVQLPGWIPHDQIAPLMQRSDVTVLLADTNFHDGLPNVVLESMAVGLPVVISPLPAAGEAICDGRTGFVLSRPDAVDELVDRLQRLACDPELLRTMGRAGRQVVEERFDEQREYGRLVELFCAPAARRDAPKSTDLVRPTLSVVTIAKDEERDLPGFLRSFMPYADEIVIVDDGSSDRTAELADKAGSKVKLLRSRRAPGEGFDAQRNKAIAAATGDWLLHVDVDMRMTTEFARELQAAIRDERRDVWTYRRANYFLNRPMFHAMRGDCRYPWLVRQGLGRFSLPVHEVLTIEAPPERWGHLENRMHHLGDEDFGERLRKNLLYSDLERTRSREAGFKRRLWQVAMHPAWLALRTYFVDRAYLDGRAGIFWSLYQLSGSLNRYLLEYADTLTRDRASLERRILTDDRGQGDLR